jgi:hypothetical protein
MPSAPTNCMAGYEFGIWLWACARLAGLPAHSGFAERCLSDRYKQPGRGRRPARELAGIKRRVVVM